MFLIYFLCLGIVGFGWVSGLDKVTGEVLTDLTYDLLNTINGVYNNTKQVGENKGHAPIVLVIQPLLLINLSPKPIVYTEWAVNGKVSLAQVSNIEEKGENVYFNIRQVSKALGMGSQEFDVKQLATYAAGDLSAFVPGCVAVFRRLAKGVYTGYWSECTTRVSGNFINYAYTSTCTTVGTVLPPSLAVFNEIPYVFHRTSDIRFPLPQGPDTYKKQCLPKCQ